MTGKGGDCVLSIRTGMRPFGLRRRNQSFFCSLLMMLLLESGGWFRKWLWEGVGGGKQGTLHEGLGPCSAVDVGELFEHNLYLYAVGSAHCDEVEPFCVFDLRRGVILEQV